MGYLSDQRIIRLPIYVANLGLLPVLPVLCKRAEFHTSQDLGLVMDTLCDFCSCYMYLLHAVCYKKCGVSSFPM